MTGLDALLDETSERWQSVERAIWPNGPADGHGSGVYAGLKADIISTLARLATGLDEMDDQLAEAYLRERAALAAAEAAPLDVDRLARALRPYTRELLFAGDKGYSKWLIRTAEGVARTYRDAEAEARADAIEVIDFQRGGYAKGRADALREAAERVRALDVTLFTTSPLVKVEAVLAILDPETK
jgi:hypothetical protein